MRRTALLLPLLLLPGCSGDVDVERTAQVQRPLETPAPTAEPSPPTRRTSSPTATPTPAAPVQPAPARSAAPARHTAAQGDVDGDGTPDELAYAGREVVVTLSGSGREVRAGTGAEDAAPSTAGVEDVDRDGRAEVFVSVGSGASTAFLTPFRFDGTTFAPLTIDGAQARLGVGGSATHGDGFSCDDAGTLVVRSASSDDGTTFTVTSTTYRVDGHRLVQAGRTTGTAQGMDDPRVGKAYLVDCRSVGEGG
jgi:hypothetical protein